ncbi:MAG: contractile injection system tape measure protein [Crocosphaera sp.]
MSQQHHIIAKTILAIDSDGQDEMWSLQEEISHILQQKAIPAMEQLFEELIPPNEVIRLDQVVVELDPIDSHHLEEEFVQQLIQGLRRTLSDRLYTSSSMISPTDNGVQSLSSTTSSDIIRRGQSQSEWEVLLYFLEYGRFPWWYLCENWSTCLSQWERVISETKDWQTPLQTLLNQSPTARKRLIWQFPPGFQHQILLQLKPTWIYWRILLADVKQLCQELQLGDRLSHILEENAWLWAFLELGQDSSSDGLFPTQNWMHHWLNDLLNILLLKGLPTETQYIISDSFNRFLQQSFLSQFSQHRLIHLKQKTRVYLYLCSLMNSARLTDFSQWITELDQVIAKRWGITFLNNLHEAEKFQTKLEENQPELSYKNQLNQQNIEINEVLECLFYSEESQKELLESSQKYQQESKINEMLESLNNSEKSQQKSSDNSQKSEQEIKINEISESSNDLEENQQGSLENSQKNEQKSKINEIPESSNNSEKSQKKSLESSQKYEREIKINKIPESSNDLEGSQEKLSEKSQKSEQEIKIDEIPESSNNSEKSQKKSSENSQKSEQEIKINEISESSNNLEGSQQELLESIQKNEEEIKINEIPESSNDLEVSQQRSLENSQKDEQEIKINEIPESSNDSEENQQKLLGNSQKYQQEIKINEIPESSNDSDENQQKLLEIQRKIEIKKYVNRVNKSSLSQEEEMMGLFVKNAGLVILHPFLQIYFEKIGLLEDKKFSHPTAQQTAIYLLNYLATRQTKIPEYELVLPKFLCGWPLNETVTSPETVPNGWLQEGENLLENVINYWSALKNTTPDGLREGFLQRSGKLTKTSQGDWRLQIEQMTIDILLSRLPWGLNIIKLPWMETLLNVEWN